MKRVTNTENIKAILATHGATCYLCGEVNLHYSGAIPENVDPSSPNEVVILCKRCSSQRRKQPIHVYVSRRFSQVASEYARLAVLLGQLPVATPPKKSVPVHTNADLDALVDDWGDEPNVSPVPNVLTDAQVALLPRTDPRLDETSTAFDEALYERWVHL